MHKAYIEPVYCFESNLGFKLHKRANKCNKAVSQYEAYSGPQCRRDYMRNLAILGDISKNL